MIFRSPDQHRGIPQGPRAGGGDRPLPGGCLARPARPARASPLPHRRSADHLELNRSFEKYTWNDLPGAMESWVRNFTHRVTDISSLGNVMSTQNRYVQVNYVAKEKACASGWTCSRRR